MSQNTIHDKYQNATCFDTGVPSSGGLLEQRIPVQHAVSPSLESLTYWNSKLHKVDQHNILTLQCSAANKYVTVSRFQHKLATLCTLYTVCVQTSVSVIRRVLVCSSVRGVSCWTSVHILHTEYKGLQVCTGSNSL